MRVPWVRVGSGRSVEGQVWPSGVYFHPETDPDPKLSDAEWEMCPLSQRSVALGA